MSERRALDESGEWLPAVQPVLVRRILESGADAYFFAALKELKADGDGYLAVFTAFGIDHRFRAAKVIDTTSRFCSRCFFGAESPVMSDMRLNWLDTSMDIRGVPSDGDIAATREMLTSENSSIVKVAWRLALTPAEKRMDFGRAAWIPSSARGNFLEAFDDGAALALPEGCELAVRAGGDRRHFPYFRALRRGREPHSRRAAPAHGAPRGDVRAAGGGRRPRQRSSIK